VPRFRVHQAPISARRRRRRQFSPLVAILADEVLRWDRNAAPRFLSQRGRALPKATARGTQGFFEDYAVLGFGAAAVLGGSSLQRFDNIWGYISDKQLRHVGSKGC
jgi:hypothetical protein